MASSLSRCWHAVAVLPVQGKHTVPSVWIGGQFVGGADELAELQRSGQLQQRLGAAA